MIRRFFAQEGGAEFAGGWSSHTIIAQFFIRATNDADALSLARSKFKARYGDEIGEYTHFEIIKKEEIPRPGYYRYVIQAYHGAESYRFF